MLLASYFIAISSAYAWENEAPFKFTNPYNPIVKHMYTADPTARVFNDTLYVYPSSDAVCPEGSSNNGFCMPGYHVFSTKDLTNWTDHGLKIHHNNVPWVQPDSFGMWAPDAIEKDGKYYFFFPAMPKDKSAFRQIGVAIADRPEGPFVPEPNYIKGIAGIDPSPFVDDDGRAYIYYGGGEKLFVAELNSDMTSIKGKAQAVEGLPPKYKEGPFMFKRKGVYYFTFPHAPDGSEEIAYAIGDSPMGPFRYQHKILDRWIDNCWTNHHSILEYKGDWYIFYHHHELSNNQHLRSMKADRITFDNKGKIDHVTSTNRGIGYVTATETLEVDRYSNIDGAQVSRNLNKTYPNWVVQNITAGAVLNMKGIDFGKKRYDYVGLHVSTTKPDAKISLFDKYNTLIAKKDIPYTPYATWQTVVVPVSHSPKGMQNLKVVFDGNTKSLQMDWLRFYTKDQALVSIGGNHPFGTVTIGDIHVSDREKNVLLDAKSTQMSTLVAVASEASDSITRRINATPVEETALLTPGNAATIGFNQAAGVLYADKVIPAQSFTLQKGISAEKGSQKVGNIGYINNGDFIYFDKIEFRKPAKKMRLSVATQTKGGNIIVHLNDSKGPVIGKVTVSNTSGWQKWQTVDIELTKELSGSQSIHLDFEGGDGYLFNLSWIQFK